LRRKELTLCRLYRLRVKARYGARSRSRRAPRAGKASWRHDAPDLMGVARNTIEGRQGSDGVWPGTVEASVVLAAFNDKPAVALTRHH
jgi:hypothetical protein